MACKICKRCSIEADLNEFGKDKNTVDGLKTWCKKCFKEYRLEPARKKKALEHSVEYYKMNKAEINKKRKEFRGNNREHMRLQNKKAKANRRDAIAAYEACRRAHKFKLTPSYLSEDDKLITALLYKISSGLSRLQGIEFHVDHRIPLCKNGKHEWTNLQIVTATYNLEKGGRLELQEKS